MKIKLTTKLTDNVFLIQITNFTTEGNVFINEKTFMFIKKLFTSHCHFNVNLIELINDDSKIVKLLSSNLLKSL